MKLLSLLALMLPTLSFADTNTGPVRGWCVKCFYNANVVKTNFATDPDDAESLCRANGGVPGWGSAVRCVKPVTKR